MSDKAREELEAKLEKYVGIETGPPQVAVQPVLMVTSWPPPTLWLLVVLPAQARVTVLGPVSPLKARRLTRRLGPSTVKLALVIPGLSDPLKERLLVVRLPQGPETYHRPFAPQSTRPVGYCPLRGTSWSARSLKVRVSGPLKVAV